MALDYLTYEYCVDVCNQNDGFIMRHDTVQGYEVAQFNYRLASYEDFAKHNAFELRGLTFVKQDDGSWRRFLMLHKFFNVNQTIGYMYDDLKDKRIEKVQDKLDGSVIRFIKLPNGNVVAKSKFSFESEQALAAQHIYETNSEVKALVDTTLNENLAVIFELIGPFNRIVVNYNETELAVLQARDEECGSYYDSLTNLYEISHSEDLYFHMNFPTLDDLLARAEVEEGHEGYIVTFDDGQMAKIKTKWYLSLHHLLTESVNRPDYVIQSIVAETIDDALAQLPQDAKEVRDYINNIQKLVLKFVVNGIKECRLMLEDKSKMERKDFAIKHNKHQFFSMIMRDWEDEVSAEELEPKIKNYLLDRTKKLSDAEQFVNKGIL